jgi:hypothetical protein
MYKKDFNDTRPKTVLSIPYFHLFLDGYNPQDFDIVVTTKDGESIKQQINKTGNGYAISFRPSKDNFNTKEGVQGLKIMILPKNSAAAKKGAEFKYHLEASDYQFKEFISMRK